MKSSTSKKLIITSLLYTLGILLVIFLYEVFALIKHSTAANKDVMKLFVPHINKILKEFVILFTKGSVYIAILNTLWRLALSILIGCIIGISLGVLGGLYPKVRVVFKPLMTILRSLPIVIFVIILLLAIKSSYIPVVATTLVVIPIIYEAVVKGVMSVDRDQRDAYLLESNTNVSVVRKIYIPSIKEFISQAFITSISFGIKVIISTEYLSHSKRTVGYLIQEARSNLKYSRLYAYLIIVLLIVSLVEAIPHLIKYIYNKKKIS